MIDHLRQIAIFAKTIDHGSFRGAAAELRLSPSVVSHHIAQLEDRLGVALIYRSTRRLTLTQHGETLLASARAMLEAAETGLNAINAQSTEPAGVLSVTLPSLLSQSRVIQDLAAFTDRFPKITLDLEFTDQRQNIIKEGYDLAIRMGPHRKRGANRQTLFKSQRVLIAASTYLDAMPRINSPDDLQEHKWVEFTPARQIKTILRKDGAPDRHISIKGQISANDALAYYRLAKTGAGLAIVPDFLATQDIAAGYVQQVLPDWQLDALETFAEWPANAPKTGLSRLLVQELVGANKD